jgi:ABC-type transport system involved in cytochrome c biogenesis permease subunit
MIFKNYYFIPILLFFLSYAVLYIKKNNPYNSFIFLIYFTFVIQSVIVIAGLDKYHFTMIIPIDLMIFFNSWILMLIVILFELLYKAKYIVIYATPIVIAALLVSYFAPSMDINAILKVDSWLLIAHIVLILTGDSLFALAFILSLIYILQERKLKLKKNLKIINSGNKNSSGKNEGRLFNFRRNFNYFNLGKGYNLELLDNMNYQCLKLGFPALTAGIVIGIYLSSALFKSVASVKPIEIISLITWLIYAILLHERVAKGLRGNKAAMLSIAGFIMIILTVGFSLYLFPEFHGLK